MPFPAAPRASSAWPSLPVGRRLPAARRRPSLPGGVPRCPAPLDHRLPAARWCPSLPGAPRPPAPCCPVPLGRALAPWPAPLSGKAHPGAWPAGTTDVPGPAPCPAPLSGRPRRRPSPASPSPEISSPTRLPSCGLPFKQVAKGFAGKIIPSKERLFQGTSTSASRREAFLRVRRMRKRLEVDRRMKRRLEEGRRMRLEVGRKMMRRQVLGRRMMELTRT
ncbi:LOW QUALITY PROTEIN: hypothetical protein U9M48_034807 [Paspalum notatum var. saurae]|uniref:Uncharacterized protein n=1 Tax=Paspalum notatum var. saurae TaxID=547442 RepID=A0AAQ3UBN0_PASNO